MAKDDLIPGDFDAATNYWIPGAKLNAMNEKFRKDRIIAGEGQREIDTGRGRVIVGVGGEGGTGTLATGLTLTTSRPRYITDDETIPAEGTLRLWITLGTVNEKLVQGTPGKEWSDYFDVTSSRSFFVKATVPADGEFLITGLEFEHMAFGGATTPPDPDWPDDGLRATEFYGHIGDVIKDGNEWIVENDGAGSMKVTEHAGHFSPVSPTADGCFGTNRQVVFYRNG